MPGILNVYLAGKISRNDWRFRIFPIRNADTSHITQNPHPHQPVVDGMRYVGPFFLACDHGCFHGDSSHGRGADRLRWAEPSNTHLEPDASRICYTLDAAEHTPQDVFQKCLKWLAEAEIVFAWVDAPSAYGTLVEVGIATALGIPVYLATSREAETRYNISREMWFAAAATGEQFRVFADVLEAWRDFVQRAHSMVQGAKAVLSEEWDNQLKTVARISLLERFTNHKPRLDFMRSTVPPRLRFEILRRDGFRCQYCGATAQETRLEVDHIIPVAKGGTSDPDNLITACMACNRGKAASDVIPA